MYAYVCLQMGHGERDQGASGKRSAMGSTLSQ